jgi:hypothetical protein
MIGFGFAGSEKSKTVMPTKPTLVSPGCGVSHGRVRSPFGMFRLLSFARKSRFPKTTMSPWPPRQRIP